MANTTFSGAVRSENNFKLISKTASTGVVADQTVGGGLKDARRYQLSEYFNKLPALNAYLQASETKDWGNIADGDEEAEEVTVTGAALGDFAVASMSIDITDLVLTAAVTAANTVTVSLSNDTGGAINLGSGTLTEITAISPSLASSPEVETFSFDNMPSLSIYLFNDLVSAVLNPAR